MGQNGLQRGTPPSPRATWDFFSPNALQIWPQKGPLGPFWRSNLVPWQATARGRSVSCAPAWPQRALAPRVHPSKIFRGEGGLLRVGDPLPHADLFFFDYHTPPRATWDFFWTPHYTPPSPTRDMGLFFPNALQIWPQMGPLGPFWRSNLVPWQATAPGRSVYCAPAWPGSTGTTSTPCGKVSLGQTDH